MIYYVICELRYISHHFSRGDACLSTQEDLLRLYYDTNGLVQKSTLNLLAYVFLFAQ